MSTHLAKPNSEALIEPTTIASSLPVPEERSNQRQSRGDDEHSSPAGSESTGDDEDSTVTLHEAEPTSSAEVTKEKTIDEVEKIGGGKGEKVEKEKFYSKEDGEEITVVDWKGPDDPLKPTNWSNGRRMTSTFIVAAFTLLAPLSSSAISPAAPQVAAKLGITASFEIAMVTSIFVLAFAIGPLLFGPASELYGRVRVLQGANVLYIIFNLVCAFAQTKGQFIAFRFLSGLGGGAPLAIGAGVLSDLWRPEERGRAAALYSLGPLLGPAIGPIFGGWVAQKLPNDGYRWIFFSTTIFSALVQTLGLFLLRETYHPVLLEYQARQIKKNLNLPKDSLKVQTIFEVNAGGKKSAKEVFARGMIRPFVLFINEPIIQVLSLYMGLLYGIIYLMLTTTNGIFENVYGQSVGIASTHFVSMGIGFAIAGQLGSRALDVIYRRLKAKSGEGKPEYRLPFQFPAAILLPLGLLLYGWGAEKKLFWITVDIGMALVSMSMILVFQSLQTYTIDTFQLHAASAVAALVCLRSLFGFALPLAGESMFNALGYGWGCTLLACASIVVSWPAIPTLWFCGERIRSKSKFAKKSK